MKTWSLILALAVAPALVSAVEIINGSGASLPAPLIAAWADAYQKETGVQVTYQAIGSDGGLRQIGDRTVDFGVTEEPATVQELEKERLWQFPFVIGGVVPVVNIEGVQAGSLQLDGATLSKIYLGQIKFWDDLAVQHLNPNLKLPHAPIQVVYRSEASGITAIFAKYLANVSPEWKKEVGMGRMVRFPVGVGAKGSEGVMHKLIDLGNAIGYVDYTFALQNKLAYTTMNTGKKEPVEAGVDSFSEPTKWPLAGTSYVLLSKEKKEIDQRVIQFFTWAFEHGDAQARELGYAPLSQKAKAALAH